MALITWSPDYSVGNEEIDSQHKKLIEIINTLHDGMKAGKGKVILGDILDELTNYTGFHFAVEEKLFEKYNYPDTITHKQAHADMVERVLEFREGYVKGSSLLTLEIMNFLRDWLVNHIAKSDKNYSAYFKEKGVFH